MKTFFIATAAAVISVAATVVALDAGLTVDPRGFKIDRTSVDCMRLDRLGMECNSDTLQALAMGDRYWAEVDEAREYESVGDEMVRLDVLGRALVQRERAGDVR